MGLLVAQLRATHRPALRLHIVSLHHHHRVFRVSVDWWRAAEVNARMPDLAPEYEQKLKQVPDCRDALFDQRALVRILHLFLVLELFRRRNTNSIVALILHPAPCLHTARKVDTFINFDDK